MRLNSICIVEYDSYATRLEHVFRCLFSRFDHRNSNWIFCLPSKSHKKWRRINKRKWHVFYQFSGVVIRMYGSKSVMQARSEGGQRGPCPPQLGKIPKNLSKWPFSEYFFSASIYLSTFSKFAPNSRQRQKNHFGILAPRTRGSRYGPELSRSS